MNDKQVTFEQQEFYKYIIQLIEVDLTLEQEQDLLKYLFSRTNKETIVKMINNLSFDEKEFIFDNID